MCFLVSFPIGFPAPGVPYRRTLPGLALLNDAVTVQVQPIKMIGRPGELGSGNNPVTIGIVFFKFARNTAPVSILSFRSRGLFDFFPGDKSISVQIQLGEMFIRTWELILCQLVVAVLVMTFDQML